MELLCTDLWTMCIYMHTPLYMFVLEITVKQVGGQEKSMYNVCARACEIILEQTEGIWTFSDAVCWCVKLEMVLEYCGVFTPCKNCSATETAVVK